MRRRNWALLRPRMPRLNTSGNRTLEYRRPCPGGRSAMGMVYRGCDMAKRGATMPRADYAEGGDSDAAWAYEARSDESQSADVEGDDDWRLDDGGLRMRGSEGASAC